MGFGLVNFVPLLLGEGIPFVWGQGLQEQLRELPWGQECPRSIYGFRNVPDRTMGSGTAPYPSMRSGMLQILPWSHELQEGHQKLPRGQKCSRSFHGVRNVSDSSMGSGTASGVSFGSAMFQIILWGQECHRSFYGLRNVPAPSMGSGKAPEASMGSGIFQMLLWGQEQL